MKTWKSTCDVVVVYKLKDKTYAEAQLHLPAAKFDLKNRRHVSSKKVRQRLT